MTLRSLKENHDVIFSVVIPLHNKQQHIRKCINSILDQSLKNFEVLVIDDASSDQSVDIVRSFDDARIAILSRATPGPGGYAARNFGAMHASAEWLTFLDADDHWRPNHLEEIRSTMSQFPDVPLFFTGFEKIGKKTEQVCASSMKDLTAAEAMRQLSEKDIFHVNTMAIRKEIYISSDGFFEDRGWRRGGDSELWPRLLASAERVVMVPKVTATWDIRNSGITVESFDASMEHPALTSFNEGNIVDQGDNFRRSQHIFAVRKQLMWDAKAPVGAKPIWKSMMLFLRGPITMRTTKEFFRFIRRSIAFRLRK